MGLLSKIQRLGYAATNSRLKKYTLLFHTVSCDLSLRMVFQEEMTAWQPDIVHAHDGISLPLAAKVAEACNAKLVFDSHELETHRNPPLPWVRKMQVVHLERKYLPKANAIFTVGRKISRYLEKTYKIAPPTVLYNSPRKEPHPIPDRQMTLDRSDIRDEIQVRAGEFLLVHTGNVTYNRGLEQAVIGLSKAAIDPKFRSKWPRGIHFAMIGNRVPAVVNRINKLHEKYGERIKISFLDPIAPNKIVEYIRTADACISPGIPLVLSYEFGMPNKLFEAILSGRPIIASDLVEQKETIEGHRLGLCYQADDTDALSQAFIELAVNYTSYIHSPTRHRELVDLFCWEAQEVKLLEVYAKL